ncbi:MAG: hypothetical protein NVV82_22370 [Sporocytophaga sp.]|nr:hypothetical protein [Sporocytophaga sp.]
MIKKIVFVLLVILLLADLGYSFLQHYHMPFDGDIASCIVPADDIKPILSSPLGFKVFQEGITYPNPNRFFCHWSFYEFFNTIPLFLQKFVSPLDSAYLSCAIAKILIQITLIALLAISISGSIFKFDFLLAAVLISPLFQANGYRSYMGIIDPSITYTFFYALPAILIIIYFFPLFMKYFYSIEMKGYKYIKYLWTPLALISSLSGPLNPGISLVIVLLLFLHKLTKNAAKSEIKNSLLKLKYAIQQIPNDYYFFSIPITIFSIYSLFLGSYNSFSLSSKLPLSELYSRLPLGVYYSFTQKLGFPILFAILIINTIIIHYTINTTEGKKILTLFKWFGLFALIYILLLPLGGYRNYRPNVLRYDTIMPITLGLMFFFGKTSIFILNNFSNRKKYWYIPLLVLVLFVFENADEPEFNKNECERKSIIHIAESPEQIIKIDNGCTVLSWYNIEKPEESWLYIRQLKLWGIVKDENKRYYQ